MTSTVSRMLGVGTLLLLAGCRSVSPSAEHASNAPLVTEQAAAKEAVATEDAEMEDAPEPAASWPNPEESTIQTTGLEFPPVADPAPAPREPAAGLPLTIDSAIAVALDRNPALISLRASEPVAHAAYHVSEVYPWNPFVQVAVLPYARDKAGDLLGVNHYVWLMQTVELAHQQRHREASASAAWGQVRWNIVQAELANAAQTERLYFTALYQRELRDLAVQAARLNEQLRGVVDRRFKAALATAAEQTTIKVAVRQSQRQAELAEANYQTALLALQRQLNLTGEESISLTGRLDDFTWLPFAVDEPAVQDPRPVAVSADLVNELAQQRPDVLAAASGMGVAQANANLARANQIPNVAIGPFYERDESGTVFAGFRTQMNLPVWDSGRPLTSQRIAERNLQCVTYTQLRSRAAVEARTALERYERARRMLEDQRRDQAAFESKELQEIEDQFAAGQATILNVFNLQTNLLQERRTYFDLLNEVAQAAADVTLLAGLPPARLIADQHEPPENLPRP